MSASPDSVGNQEQFRSRVPPAEPITTRGHAPGVKVGNDARPEFNLETHPAGTAPAEHSYRADPEAEVPGQADNSAVDPSSRTDALASLPGATSGEVYKETEFGKPIQGQSGQELHGAHAGSRKKERSGLEGVGVTSGEFVESKVRSQGADLKGPAGEAKGTRGKSGRHDGGVNWTGAEERIPVSAEEVAAERD